MDIRNYGRIFLNIYISIFVKFYHFLVIKKIVEKNRTFDN